MQSFSGLEYLKIDIASNYGLDKETWDYRISWFNENKDNLMNLVNQAEEPALFYAGVKAYRAAMRNEPSGYPISLDATASGLQLLAVLTGDRSAAALCNVIDTGNREDAYTVVYNDMLRKLGEGAKIKREDTKRSIMTSLYGSTAVPKEVFGEGQLLQVFLETMNELAPGAWELNEAFLHMWNPDAYAYEWVLPDNFHVKTKVMTSVKETVHFLNEPFDIYYKVNAPTQEGRSLAANTVHSLDGMIVREMTRRCDYDPVMVHKIKLLLEDSRESANGKDTSSHDDNLVMTLWNHYEKSGFLSARILQHLKAENIGHVERSVIRTLVYSLPKKPFKVLAIHDCFRCLPNYGDDLRWQYNTILHNIAKSNMLNFLVSQILGRPVFIKKLDSTLADDILKANYALS